MPGHGVGRMCRYFDRDAGNLGNLAVIRSLLARPEPEMTLLPLIPMDPAHAQRLRAIFDEAAERPQFERDAFVRAACQDDSTLEREVFSLLRSLDSRGDAMEVDAAAWFGQEAGSALGEPDRGAPGDAAASTAGRDLHGVVIGDFRLIRRIGRGGIGTVYEAEQLSLERRVAIKLLQSWTASRDTRRRFVEESAILARLSHPGIAQVIAAGTRELDLGGPDKTLAAGLFNDLHSVPWIAMELVDEARTIVNYCRESRLEPLEILGVFARVCDAVHYGHQQGVIHRDIKPANILVNARGEAKVIDFGVAKAIGTGPISADAGTLQGGLLGTLRYMSPEQCDGGGRPADTRSDVYALGVVLYETLTGQLPYKLDESSYTSPALAICTTVPQDPRDRSPAVPNDAAVVVLKALRKEPDHRYQSAADLAADLRRVIAREPVVARKASAPYKLTMFARRRPVMTVLVAAAVLGLIAGIVGISLGLARERAARSEAEGIAWLANLTAADSSLRLGDGGAAMRRLNAVPEQRRGWEWRHLHALADTSTSRWQITDKVSETFLSPSGRWAYCTHLDDENTKSDIIDIASRQIIARVEDGIPSGTVTWNSDESLIALPQRGVVALVDAKTGLKRRTWAQQSERFPLGAGFSADGALLAVGLSDFAGVEVYDLRTGKTVFSKPSDSWVYSTAFSPDCRTLAWSDAKGVQSVQISTWQPLRFVETSRLTAVEPGGLSYSPDGRLLAVICGLVVQVIDVETWTIRATLRGHAQRIHSLSFDDSGERIVTTSIDRTARIWNAQGGELVTTLLGHESPTRQACFIRSALPGEANVITVDDTSRVRTWNLSANGPTISARANDTTAYIRQLDFSSDGSTLRAAGQDSIITVGLSGRPRFRSIKPLSNGFLNVIPGKDLVLRNSHGVISLESLSDQSRVWSLDDEPAYEFVVSPDGSLAGVFREGMCISIIRVEDGVELGRTSPADPTGYHRPTFSPDNTALATLSRSGVLRLWNARNGALIDELVGEGDRSNGLCWSDDGSLLAYSHAREGVTVIDMHTRRLVTRIEGVGGNVWSIAISPDKTRMAVGAQDRITHIYHLPSGEELLQLRDHTGTVMSVAWSPDGRYLATGGYDKRIFIYDGNTVLNSAK